ncbi:MAG: hypothetical protein EBT07_14120, partial [Actinobacteria bacterium]|nr:hypothetical protein [Actinomycetota bacterium]
MRFLFLGFTLFLAANSFAQFSLPVFDPAINPPTSLTASAVTDTAVTISWAQPASGTPPTGYVILYESITDQSSGYATGTYTTGSTTTQGTLSGLSPGTTIKFYVRGITGYNSWSGSWSSEGNRSAPLIVTTTGNSPKPNPPRNLYAENVSSNSITLKWTAPISNSITPTDYKITYNSISSGWLVYNHPPSTATTATLTNLPWDTFQVRVESVNSGNNSLSKYVQIDVDLTIF